MVFFCNCVLSYLCRFDFRIAHQELRSCFLCNNLSFPQELWNNRLSHLEAWSASLLFLWFFGLDSWICDENVKPSGFIGNVAQDYLRICPNIFLINFGLSFSIQLTVTGGNGGGSSTDIQWHRPATSVDFATPDNAPLPRGSSSPPVMTWRGASALEQSYPIRSPASISMNSGFSYAASVQVFPSFGCFRGGNVGTFKWYELSGVGGWQETL